MARFLIEGNWYLVEDEFSWALAKPAGGTNKKTGEILLRMVSFHSTPEEALNYYLRQKQRESAMNHTDGTIKDLIGILIAEKERLSDVLQNVFHEVQTAELRP